MRSMIIFTALLLFGSTAQGQRTRHTVTTYDNMEDWSAAVWRYRTETFENFIPGEFTPFNEETVDSIFDFRDFHTYGSTISDSLPRSLEYNLETRGFTFEDMSIYAVAGIFHLEDNGLGIQAVMGRNRSDITQRTGDSQFIGWVSTWSDELVYFTGGQIDTVGVPKFLWPDQPISFEIEDLHYSLGSPQIPPIPEPSAALLVGMFVLMMSGSRRRSR